MGNTKSEPQEPGFTGRAANDRLSQNEIIQAQAVIIKQLRQDIRTREEGRLAQKISRGTQTDQDDVVNLRAIQRPTPSIRYYNVQYSHHVTDSWIYAAIQRPTHAEPLGKSNTAIIRVYNASTLTWSYRPKRIIQTSLPQLRIGEKLYYHGSNDQNVKSIIENGIDVTKSTRATDFSCGHGFYVTKNFGKAIEWSKRVVGWKGGRPAVVAFKISQNLRKEEPHISLKVDSTTNRKWWECVVSHFRHSGISQDVVNVLQDIKFIKGPVANNKYVGFDELPRPYDFTQLCIRDQEYALRFGSLENISFVIFAVIN